MSANELRKLPGHGAVLHKPPPTRIWMIVLRGYLVLAGGPVRVRIVQLAISGG
jgi:hypothetical protein